MLHKVIIMLNLGYILMNIPMSECRINYFGRNYVRNLENNIINMCNNNAFKTTNDEMLYYCIKDNHNKCYDMVNYTKFMKIRNNCINERHQELGFGVFIYIAMFALYGVFANIVR